MCGPLVFYNDYIAFIDGSIYKTSKQGKITGDIPSPLVRNQEEIDDSTDNKGVAN